MDLVTAAGVKAFPKDGVPLDFRGTTYTVKRWTVKETAKHDKDRKKWGTAQIDAHDSEDETPFDVTAFRLDDMRWWLHKVLGSQATANGLIKAAQEAWDPPEDSDDTGVPFGIEEIQTMVSTMVGMARGTIGADGRADPKEND